MSSSLVVAHALDTSQTWFSSNPMTGGLDGSLWWDVTLTEVCSGLCCMCFIRESMGACLYGIVGRLAARHCTQNGLVVAFVPQICLEDFLHSIWADISADCMSGLCEAIQQACQETEAPVSIHVGKDEDDLYQQLNYLPKAVNNYDVVGEDVDASLPRDGNPSCTVVGDNKLRMVKHDVKGHTLAAGLKLQGVHSGRL